jgi:hypothetical protein
LKLVPLDTCSQFGCYFLMYVVVVENVETISGQF